MCFTAFKNKNELVSYANKFVKERIEVFRKDISICLTADKNNRHAYMPALLTCISLLELFSGLYAGKLKNIGLTGILDYSKKFLDSSSYTCDRLSVLYEMFRHKIVHVTQPYGVFDTHSVNTTHVLQKNAQRLITWQVNATNRQPPIDILPNCGTLIVRPPWPVQYTHKCIVSIYRLKVDFCKSATGLNGYLDDLKTNVSSQRKFESCMLEFFKK